MIRQLKTFGYSLPKEIIFGQMHESVLTKASCSLNLLELKNRSGELKEYGGPMMLDSYDLAYEPSSEVTLNKSEHTKGHGSPRNVTTINFDSKTKNGLTIAAGALALAGLSFLVGKGIVKKPLEEIIEESASANVGLKGVWEAIDNKVNPKDIFNKKMENAKTSAVKFIESIKPNKPLSNSTSTGPTDNGVSDKTSLNAYNAFKNIIASDKIGSPFFVGDQQDYVFDFAAIERLKNVDVQTIAKLGLLWSQMQDAERIRLTGDSIISNLASEIFKNQDLLKMPSSAFNDLINEALDRFLKLLK